MKNLERFEVIVGNKENLSGFSQPTGEFCIIIGNITIRNPRSKKKGRIYISNGRVGKSFGMEGGEFKVSELEKAIQDFFDKNF